MADAEAEASAYSASFIDQAILSVEAELDGISGLKAEQKGALKAILNGEDVLALLPTGFGKSLIYQILPRVCKRLSEMEGCSLFHDVESPIVIVVSPLVALMEDQIKEASKFGVSAAQLGKSDEEILSGKAELVFGSPESWLLNEKWRVCWLLPDTDATSGEGPKGNPAFRESFSRLGELRSLVKEGIPILALTASADRPSRDRVISLLNMQGAQRIVVSPNKTNIKLGIVRLPDDKLQCLDWLAKMLREEGLAAPYVLIYCRSISTTGKVFRYLKRQLGEDAWIILSVWNLATDVA
ncbi:hypothetical protein Bbelb_119360 [Branchiostoma belcheri]|nr:hypothetical protein Bbelb_119360 [Branchiostoma belcheri]